MSDPNPDPIDWSLTTHEGNRRRQRLEFLALPLREKILRIEHMCEVVAHFDRLRKGRTGARTACGDDQGDACSATFGLRAKTQRGEGAKETHGQAERE